MDGETIVLPCQNELFEYSGKWNEVEDVSQNDQIFKTERILAETGS